MCAKVDQTGLQNGGLKKTSTKLSKGAHGGVPSAYSQRLSTPVLERGPFWSHFGNAFNNLSLNPWKNHRKTTKKQFQKSMHQCKNSWNINVKRVQSNQSIMKSEKINGFSEIVLVRTDFERKSSFYYSKTMNLRRCSVARNRQISNAMKSPFQKNEENLCKKECTIFIIEKWRNANMKHQKLSSKMQKSKKLYKNIKRSKQRHAKINVEIESLRKYPDTEARGTRARKLTPLPGRPGGPLGPIYPLRALWAPEAC